MRTFVVDASVGAKWFLPASAEPLSAEAHQLLDLYTHGLLGLCVPDLFWAEIDNVLWKAVRQNRITVQEAANAITQGRNLEVVSLPTTDLLTHALQIALATGSSLYDSLYVAAAMALKVSLLTADDRLVRTAGARYPISWLGVLKSLL